MLVENVSVRREDVGGLGVAEATVLAVEQGTATISLDSWVDEDGFGPTETGDWTRKEFPSTIVLLDASTTAVDETDFTRTAELAYIGTQGRHYGDRYYAEFEAPPPEGVYEAFFPHKVRTEEGAEPFITEVKREDYSVSEVIDRLKAENTD